MLFKEIVDGRTDARSHGRTTDDGRRTLKDHKSSLSTSCSGELKNNVHSSLLVCEESKLSFLHTKKPLPGVVYGGVCDLVLEQLHPQHGEEVVDHLHQGDMNSYSLGARFN